jgi:hypothetical protein
MKGKLNDDGRLRHKTKNGPGSPGERGPAANEAGKPGDRDPGKPRDAEVGGLDERDPGIPGDSGLGNAGEMDVDRGSSPSVAGGTGSGNDGGRRGDGVSLGDLLTRRGATMEEAFPFLSSPIPKGGGTSIKPVCVSAGMPNLFMSNCLASSSDIDPTDPNEPITVSGPYVEVDAKVVPDVEVDAEIEDEVDSEAGSIVFDAKTEEAEENMVSDLETNPDASEAPFAWSILPYSVSPGTSLSVSPESIEYIDPFLDLVLSEPPSAAE